MIINCSNCNNELNRKPSRIAKYKNQFCNKNCRDEYNRKQARMIIPCGYCGTLIEKFKREINESKSGKVFCNSSCATSYNGTLFKGIKAKNWKDGSRFYRDIALRELPNKCNRCSYDKYKEILEVHHIDYDRLNNDINNLEILCPNCHSIEHLVNH